MKQKFEKGSEMFFMFQDYWKLIQDFWTVEDNKEYWEDFVEAADEFYKKYPTQYAKALAIALIDDRERSYREMMKNGKEGKK